MQNGESVVSADGSLRVTLLSLDTERGKGQIKVEELNQEPKRFYIRVKFSKGEENSIDYKTWDVSKASEFQISTMNRNDMITAIEIVSTDSIL
jgi:hypothetical protein